MGEPIAILSGPTSGTLGVPSTFTVSQSMTSTGTVTPSDGLSGSTAGIFVPTFLSWNGTSQSQTFTYTPNKTGVISISITASEEAVSGSPISFTVFNQTTSVVITGPTPAGNGLIAAKQGTATGNFTVTPNGSLNDTIILRDGRAGGTFTPSSLTFTNSATPQTFTYTPAVTSTIDISFVSLAGIIQYPQRFTIDSGPPVATTLTLTGPTTANAGFGTPVPFTVTPNGTYTGVVTPSDSSTGTFTPAKLIWLNGSNSPQTFIYQPANTESGSKNVSITASPSLTLVGSPIAVTVNAATPIQNFGVGAFNKFYSPNATNS
jgi:hypothetical protein